MDDSILDMSDDEIIVKDTQDSFSPKNFSKNIVNRLGIKSHNRGTETVDSITLTPPVKMWEGLCPPCPCSSYSPGICIYATGSGKIDHVGS